jgi:hypothetical protein
MRVRIFFLSLSFFPFMILGRNDTITEEEEEAPHTVPPEEGQPHYSGLQLPAFKHSLADVLLSALRSLLF